MVASVTRIDPAVTFAARTATTHGRPAMRTIDTILRIAKGLGRFGACSVALVFGVCANQPSIAMKTLDGKPPLIIGHRGLPGLFPEEVIAGYRAAIAAGTDALELDLQSSSDGS